MIEKQKVYCGLNQHFSEGLVTDVTEDCQDSRTVIDEKLSLDENFDYLECS